MAKKKTPTDSAARTQAAKKAPPKRKSKSKLSGDKPKTILAFRPFKLEDEWNGKNLMRSLVMCIHGGKHARNVHSEISMLYCDAISRPKPWQGYFKQAGQIVAREKHEPIPPQEAAEELIRLTLDSIKYVSLLYERMPDLCRQIAHRLPEWPISADLTAKDWKRDGQRLVDDLHLGAGIAGYLKSARTSDENPIRLYATAMHDALFQTRFDQKRAEESTYINREGCPPWAAKTLLLLRFIKSNVAQWMKVGKEMLLEQRPDFIEDESFQSQKFKWTRRAASRSKSGKPTLRAIQNEAFTDIAKEMKNLAPVEPPYRGEW